MFAILKRSPKNRSNPNPNSDNPPALQIQAEQRQEPFGASMKFQYGSGDTPLDGYIIKRGVGAGAFGEVYFAESDSGKEVALKRIQKNLDVEIRGVRHCLNLRHPNLVAIYDIRFDKNEQGWIVMEFIEGDSLRDRMDRSPTGMPAAETMQLFSQLAAGVAYLHDQGIVHRDLKPANVFIDNGLIKIGDYGLSKYISASRRGGQTESVGTFHYMAPEIGKGEYGKEIDIYSLGIILYELLTGNVPFDGESSQEIILKHLTADPDLSNVPQPFAYAIERALAKNPASRFRDCREMLSVLGWELDSSGLAVKNARGGEANMPPVLEPLPGIQQTAAYTPSRHRPVGGNWPAANPVAGFGSKPRGAQAGASQPNAGSDNPSPYFNNEPVARAIQNAFFELQTMTRNLPPGIRAVVIVFSILFLIMNSYWIAPVLFSGFACYVVYYVVWYLAGGPNKVPQYKPSANQQVQYVRPGQQARNTYQPAGVQPALDQTAHYNASAASPAAQPVIKPAKYVSNKDLLRNWQIEQRNLLQKRGFWERTHALTRSLSFAGIATAVLAIGGGFLAMSNNAMSHQWLGGIAWLGIMTLLTSWSILFLSRRWESKTEDSIVYRFFMMVIGMALGVISFQVSEYLMIPWDQITHQKGVTIQWFDTEINKTWRGFYDDNSMPLIAGHIAYFGLLMWLVRWWRQSDILRRKRFAMWPIAWSVAMAGLAQGLFYFPGPWCYILGGTTSFVVQMASPWIDYQSQPKVA